MDLPRGPCIRIEVLGFSGVKLTNLGLGVKPAAFRQVRIRQRVRVAARTICLAKRTASRVHLARQPRSLEPGPGVSDKSAFPPDPHQR